MKGKSPIAERAYTSAWHLLIAGVGVYELRNHKTKLSKVLACGLIAFHADGAIADILDVKPLSRRVLEYIVGAYETRKTFPRPELPQKGRSRLR